MEDLLNYIHAFKDEHEGHEEELMRRVARNDPTLKDLSLDGGDTKWMEVFGYALRTNTHILELRFTDLVLTEAVAHSLARGMAHSKVEVLSLRGYIQKAPHEPLPIQQLRDVFYRGIANCTTMEVLSFCQTMMNGEDPGEAWKDALMRVMSISMFAVDGRGRVQAFADVLSRTTLLKELTIHLQKLDAHGMTTLAQGLRRNTSLTDIWMSHLSSPPSHRKLLFAQGLSPNSAMSTLSAVNCNIDDDCIDLLASRWLPNCPMQIINLIENNIGPTGAQQLMQAAAAAHPVTVSKLILSRNKSIGYAGLRLIGNEISNLQHLKLLVLDQCTTIGRNHAANKKSAGAQAQAKARQQAGEALLEGIKRNLSITELVVSGNGLAPNVEKEIELYCALNKMGRYLLLSINYGYLATSVWCHVLAKCQGQPKLGPSLVYFYLREQPTLVQPSLTTTNKKKKTTTKKKKKKKSKKQLTP